MESEEQVAFHLKPLTKTLMRRITNHESADHRKWWA